MANDIKNVFISHIHKDDEGLGGLKKLVPEHGLEIRDGSINSQKPNAAEDPDHIKQSILASQIEWASTLVVYVTPDAKYSEWVNWEMIATSSVHTRTLS